jgi:hypothetical protein
VAIGYFANAQGGSERIAIGHGVTNEVDDSAALRGTLYLDGGTGVYYRSTFGSGEWTDLKAGLATGTPVYTETDPVWLAEKSGYATGTPLYAEADPVWTNAEPGYLKTDGARAMTGNLNMGNNSITNVNTNSIVFADGTVLDPAVVARANAAISSTVASNSFVNQSGGTMSGTLTINNAIVVGSNTTAAAAGMIRFNPSTTNFEGYTGTEWVSLTARYAP